MGKAKGAEQVEWAGGFGQRRRPAEGVLNPSWNKRSVASIMFREGQHAKHAQPRDDNIKDGTEDANHNGKIDGDNGDGLYSKSEIWTETSPNLADSDDDEISDYWEIEYKYDPLSNDTDGDGLLDNEEDKNKDGKLATSNPNDIENQETDPTKSDTDGDGLDDNMEIAGWTVVIIHEATKEQEKHYTVSSDPRNPDSEGDGLTDLQEYSNVTDPWKSDSDGDGKTDLQELTGDYNSSATGIDGEPPEIWHFDCNYDGSDYKGLGKLKIPTKLIAYVEVGAKDLFGIKYILVDITGLENKRIDTDNMQNVSYRFEWTISGLSKIKSAVWDGFELNVTVVDRNDNLGYKKDEIGSIKDIVVSFFIGALLAYVEFISELVTGFLSWIEDAIRAQIEAPMNTIMNYIDTILYEIATMIGDMLDFIWESYSTIMEYANEYIEYIKGISLAIMFIGIVIDACMLLCCGIESLIATGIGLIANVILLMVSASSDDEDGEGFLSLSWILSPITDLFNVESEDSKAETDKFTHYFSSGLILFFIILGILYPNKIKNKAKMFLNVADIYKVDLPDDIVQKKTSIIRSAKIAVIFGIISLIMFLLSELIYIRLIGIIDEAQLEGIAITFGLIGSFLAVISLVQCIKSIISNTWTVLGILITVTSCIINIGGLILTVRNIILARSQEVTIVG